MSRRTFIITAKIPPWAQWILRYVNIPDMFRLEELSERQLDAIKLAAGIGRMIEEGLLRVEFTDEDEGPILILTEKGERKYIYACDDKSQLPRPEGRGL